MVHSVLDRPKGMLRDGFPSLHLLRFGPYSARHLIQQGFIYPPRNPPSALVSRTPGSEFTPLARPLGIVPDIPSQLGGLKTEVQGLSCRTPVAVMVGIVAEVPFAIQTQAAVGRGVGLGDVGSDTLLTEVFTQSRERLGALDTLPQNVRQDASFPPV